MPWWRDNNDSIYQIIHKSLLACLWCFIIGSGWAVEHSKGAWSTLIMTNNSNLRPRVMRVIELICIMCCSVNSKSAAHTHVSTEDDNSEKIDNFKSIIETMRTSSIVNMTRLLIFFCTVCCTPETYTRKKNERFPSISGLHFFMLLLSYQKIEGNFQ